LACSVAVYKTRASGYYDFSILSRAVPSIQQVEARTSENLGYCYLLQFSDANTANLGNLIFELGLHLYKLFAVSSYDSLTDLASNKTGSKRASRLAFVPTQSTIFHESCTEVSLTNERSELVKTT